MANTKQGTDGQKLKWIVSCTCNISNKRDSVSLGYPNTKKRDENMTHSGVHCIFDKIRGVWIAQETLAQVFDISSRSKQKAKEYGEVKTSKSMLIKTGYPTSFTVVIFFVST